MFLELNYNNNEHTFIINTNNIVTVNRNEDGSCLIITDSRNSIYTKESYEEVKSMIPHMDIECQKKIDNARGLLEFAVE